MEFLVGYIIVCLILNIVIAITLPIFEVFYDGWRNRSKDNRGHLAECKGNHVVVYAAVLGLISLVAIQVALK